MLTTGSNYFYSKAKKLKKFISIGIRFVYIYFQMKIQPYINF